jgi:hypothetical protein
MVVGRRVRPTLLSEKSGLGTVHDVAPVERQGATGATSYRTAAESARCSAAVVQGKVKEEVSRAQWELEPRPFGGVP